MYKNLSIIQSIWKNIRIEDKLQHLLPQKMDLRLKIRVFATLIHQFLIFLKTSRTPWRKKALMINFLPLNSTVWPVAALCSADYVRIIKPSHLRTLCTQSGTEEIIRGNNENIRRHFPQDLKKTNTSALEELEERPRLQLNNMIYRFNWAVTRATWLSGECSVCDPFSFTPT